MKKFFKNTGIVILSLLLVGTIYEQGIRWLLERNLYEGQTFVEIDGHKIHYVKKGTGNHTVVFVSGMGSDNVIWKEIQDKVAENACTIAYDRSGLFLSEDGDHNITNASVSHELTQLLEKTNCPKPYIIVGHSMAGIYTRPFIYEHKNEIAGVVYVDVTHPWQFKKSSPELMKAMAVPPVWFIKFLSFTGIYRAIFSFTPLSPDIPMHHPIHEQQTDFFYKSLNTTFYEAKNDRLNFQDAEKYDSFGDIPLSIISGVSPVRTANISDPELRKEYMELVRTLHDDLLKLSTHSHKVEARKSGHIVQATEPDLVVKEINLMLENDKH